MTTARLQAWLREAAAALGALAMVLTVAAVVLACVFLAHVGIGFLELFDGMAWD